MQTLKNIHFTLQKRCKKELPNLSLMTLLWITNSAVNTQLATSAHDQLELNDIMNLSEVNQMSFNILDYVCTSVNHLVFVRLKPTSFNTLLHHLLPPATFTLIDFHAYGILLAYH